MCGQCRSLDRGRSLHVNKKALSPGIEETNAYGVCSEIYKQRDLNEIG